MTRITRGHPEGADRNVHFPENPFADDGPGHTGPRSLIASFFANRALSKFRERAQQIVDDALRGYERGGDFPLVDAIGFPLPYHITRDLLGVPDVENREALRDWTWRSQELIDAFLPDAELPPKVDASGRLADHLREVLAWKRGHLGDDVFSIVIRAAEKGEIMRPEQILPFIYTLYLAGMHTTVHQTALALHTLLRHPDQWALLRAKPELLENAVEEILRFESTAQYMRRTTERTVEVGGLTIPPRVHVVCWIASANRDPAQWGPTADVFDITRSNARQHVAFGKGPHVCLGAGMGEALLIGLLASIVRWFELELPSGAPPPGHAFDPSLTLPRDRVLRVGRGASRHGHAPSA